MTPRSFPALDRIDVAVTLLLAGGTIAYILMMPWFLGDMDEAYYLYHALRVLNGEVLYRDISELITPLYIDLMAFLFWLFGPVIATARTASAVIHGGIMTLIYLTCRVLGVRRPLAAVAGLPHLAIGYIVWPFATPHWLGSVLISLLLLVNIDRRRARRTGWLLAQGVILGVLLSNRQPTGVVMALAVSVLLLADRVADHRWRSATAQPFARPLILVAVVAAAVFLPVLGAHALQAGVGPMYQQLVVQPLTGYREYNTIAWGGAWYWALINRYTYPALIKYGPLAVFAIVLSRTAIAWARGGDRRGAETLLVLFAFGVFSAVSILYLPDVIHITFILPVVLVLAADAVDAVVSWLPAPTWIGVALAGAALAANGWRLAGNFERMNEDFPFPHDTAFGRVALPSEAMVNGVDRMRRLLDDTPDRGVFIYPGWAAPYLLVGGHNPTRHDLILPRYQNDEELQGVIDALERHRPRYIVVNFVPKDDPVIAYIEQHYHYVDGLRIRNDP